MPDDNVNPIASPAPDFTPPSADVEISAEARSFAQAPISAWQNGVLASRPPTDAEQVTRLAQARELIGDRFWQVKSAPAPLSHAEREAADIAATLGVKPGATASDYRVDLPPDAPSETRARIGNFLASLELSKLHGEYLAQRLVSVAKDVGRSSAADQERWSAEQQNKIESWAKNHGWNLTEIKASVDKMLQGKDASIAAYVMHDSDLFIRLALHAQNLKRVKGG